MTERRWIVWVGVIVLLFAAVWLLRGILLPFVLGMLTAYFLDPAADRLEKWGFSRSLSTSVITAVFFVAVFFALLLIVPVLAEQLLGLMQALPNYLTTFEAEYEPKFTHWLGGFEAGQIDTIKSNVTSLSAAAGKFAGDFIAGIFATGVALVNLLSLILITPIVAFYLLRDWDLLVAKVDSLLPRAHAGTIRGQLAIIDATLAGFIRGQLNVCFLLGVYYAAGLWLAGLKFAIIVGFAAGLLVIFPYVGFLLSLAAGLGIAFFQFDQLSEIGPVLAVFFLGQVIESYFLTPRLVGEQVGLHPLWIIFGMLAGATLFGFVGVLLAIPATAVIGVLIRFFLSRYLESEYYSG